MKKRFILITLIIALALSVFACAGQENSPFSSVYYSAYGEWFVLPSCENAKVTDANGNEIAIDGGRVLFTKVGDYTLSLTKGGQTYTSKITVQKGAQPKIYPEKYMDYGVLGEEVEIIKATAKDALGEVEVSGKMYFEGEEVDISDGFYPDELGEYEYILTATSGSGVTGSMTVPYYIEESADKFNNKITSWDKPYGVNQIGIAGEYTYTTDIAFDGEDGSLGFNIGRLFGVQENNATNLNQVDISGYDGVYFFVYNDSKVAVTIQFGWSGPSYTIPSRAWTKVGFNTLQYAQFLSSGYTEQDSNITLENINGFQMIYKIDAAGDLRFNDMLYFSAMRGYKKISVKEVNELVNAEYNRDTVDFTKAEKALLYYDLLSNDEKSQVNNAGALQNRVGIVNAQYDGIEYVENKLLYFDNEKFVNALTVSFGASLSYGEDKLFNGAPTLKIKATAADFCVKVNKAYLVDASQYEVMRVSIYNGAKEELMFYNTDRNYPGIGTTNFTLKPQAWTTIVMPIRDSKVIGKHIWLREDDWGATVMKGNDFYVAPVYCYSIEELLAETQTNTNPEYDTITYLSSLLKQTMNFSEEKFTANKTLIKKIYSDIVAKVVSAQTFSAEDAVEVLELSNGFSSEFKEEIKADATSVMTKLIEVANAEAILGLRINHIGQIVEMDANLLEPVEEQLVALYESTIDKMEETNFANREYTKSMLEYGYKIGDPVAESYIALADMYRTVEFGQTIVDFSNAKNTSVFNPQQSQDLWTKDINTDIVKDGESATLRLTRTFTGSNYLDVNFSIPSFHFGGNETITFDIYYKTVGTAQAVTIMMRRGGWGVKGVTDETVATLKPNAWTTIETPLKGKTAIDGWIMIISKNWDHLTPGSEFYISNIKVKKEYSDTIASTGREGGDGLVKIESGSKVDKAWTTAQKTGVDTGSVEFTVTTTTIDFKIQNTNVISKVEKDQWVDVFFKYVPANTAKNAKVRIAPTGKYADTVLLGALTANEWTKLTFYMGGKSNLNGTLFVIGDGNDGYLPLNEGDRVYVSSAFFSDFAPDADATAKVVAFGEEKGSQLLRSASHGVAMDITWTADKKQGTDDGAVKLESAGTSNFEFKIKNNYSTATLTNNAWVKFSVFYETASAQEVIVFVSTNGSYSMLVPVATLTANDWTEVEFNVRGEVDTSNWLVVIGTDDGYGAITAGDSVYLSSVVASDRVNTEYEDSVIASLGEYGATNLVSKKAGEGDLTTAYTTDKKHGVDSGSLMVTPVAPSEPKSEFCVGLVLKNTYSIAPLTAESKVEFYVYYETTSTTNGGLVFYFKDYEGAQWFELNPNAWTKIVVTIGKDTLNDCMFALGSESTVWSNSTLLGNDKFYISSIVLHNEEA